MRSRSPAKSLLFGGVSLILFCLVFETASRIPRFVMYVRGGQVGAWAPETFRVYDIGPTGPRSFFRTQYKVERLGFRGKAPPLPGKDVADPGTLDVFCIGDSVTFGHGSSSDETTYPAYLEAWLKNRGLRQNSWVSSARTSTSGSGAWGRPLGPTPPSWSAFR